MLLLVFLFSIVQSQTDVSSFGIVTASNHPSHISVALSLTLSWNTEQWQCIINTTITPNTYYGCISTNAQPEAALITNTLPSNSYSMKINIIQIGNTTDDLIRIETVRIHDDDSNYYEISDFCVPSAFSRTAATGSSLELLECCYWSDRHKYDNFVMRGTQIVYIAFRPNVLNYPNEAHEGAVKPPIISKLGIKTLATTDAASVQTFSLTLHWDDKVYEWDALKPVSSNTSFVKTFTDSTTSCEFSSGFSLKIASISNSSSNAVGIDRIVVMDEANYSYDIEYFCNSDKIRNVQKYGDLGGMCDGEWGSYAMYDGFMYDGQEPNYFIWSQDVFLNVNSDQQGFALNDSLFSNYDCTQNTAPSSKITIFKDDMNDPTATGWTFSGSYTESLTAVNCPGGSLDPCSRIAGGGSMVIQLDISSYINIVVQYDMRLSSMTSGKRCSLYYDFDDGSSYTFARIRTSTGTSPVLYANETWNAVDHVDSQKTTITLKFSNNADYSTEYCWIDHFFVFGDYLIAVDRFSSIGSWTLYNDATLSSNRLYFNADDENAYAVREYSNINMYNNLVIRFDMYHYYRCKLYFSYDDEPWIFIGYIPYEGNTAYGWSVDLQHNIPDATVCGASVLKIKFEEYSYTSHEYIFIANVKLFGNVLQTAYPTTSPTKLPTAMPSDPSMVPSCTPTSNPNKDPTAAPTMFPTLLPTTANPTHIPTIQPTHVPSVSPTENPSSGPSQSPSFHPSLQPTTTPSSNPSFYPSLQPTTSPSSNPSTYPTLQPTATPSSNPTLQPTMTPSRPSLKPSFSPTLQPTNIPSLNPSSATLIPSLQPTLNPSSPTIPPSLNPSFPPTLRPTMNPTLYPSFTPSSTPVGPSEKATYTPVTPSDTTTTTSRTFDFCAAFDMRITTTLNTPSLMYKHLDLLMLITNSTKFSIYTDIILSRMHDVFEFTHNVWSAFEIYALAYVDITNGVAFSMEHCSYLGGISDIITSKLMYGSGKEIEHHIQSLIENDISLPIVIINIEDGVQSTETSNENTESVDNVRIKNDSYNNTISVLTGFLVTSILIIVALIAVFMLWYKKNKEIVEEEANMNLAMSKNVQNKVGNKRDENKKDNKPWKVMKEVQVDEQKENVEMNKYDNMGKEQGVVNQEVNNKDNDAEGGETKQDNPFLLDEDLSVSLDDIFGDIAVAEDFVADKIMLNDDDVVGEINKTPM